jgi:hypothetical protein
MAAVDEGPWAKSVLGFRASNFLFLGPENTAEESPRREVEIIGVVDVKLSFSPGDLRISLFLQHIDFSGPKKIKSKRYRGAQELARSSAGE